MRVSQRLAQTKRTAGAALSQNEAIHALASAVIHTILALKQENKSLTLDQKTARDVAELLFGGLHTKRVALIKESEIEK